MGKKILIIDFDEENLNVLKNQLEMERFNVITAKDGLSGFEKFEKEKPDLVIIEAFLPKLNGIQLCKKIISESENKIPIILITGIYKGLKFRELVAKEVNFSAFFEKPLDIEKLLVEINKLLKRGIKKEEKTKFNNSEKIHNSLEKGCMDKKRFTKEVKEEVDTILEKTLSEIDLYKFSTNNEMKSKNTKENEEYFEKIDEYFIGERIKEGILGDIFRIKKTGVEGFEKTLVAEKIPSYLIDNDPEMKENFINEVKFLAQLSHPGIVDVYEIKKANTYYYLIMKDISGKGLQELLDNFKEMDRDIKIEWSIFSVIKICEPLVYVFRKRISCGKQSGVIHGMLTPSNIIISPEGDVKVLGFGLAKLALKINKIKNENKRYIAPEILEKGLYSPQNDIYSLGLILYELLTDKNELPDRGSNIRHLIRKLNVPQRLQNIIEKAIQFNPEHRYSNLFEFKEDLERFIKEYERKIVNYEEITKELIKLPKEICEKEIKKNLIPQNLSPKKYRLVLIDDSIITQKIIKHSFEKENFEVILINAKEIEEIWKIKPDVILLDINSDKGVEIYNFLKNTNCFNIPLIILKEKYKKVPWEKLQELNNNAIVLKPFNTLELINKIKKIIEEKEQKKDLIIDNSTSSTFDFEFSFTNPFIEEDKNKKPSFLPEE